MESWRIVVLGDGGVGKTALAVQFTVDFPDIYDPTKEEGVYTKKFMVDNKICFVEVIDTSGFEEYTHLWARERQGFILVYSVTSRTTFERVDTFIKSMLEAKRKKPTFILVANKSDKQFEREVSREEGIALAKICGCEFMETSARTAYNVDYLFTHLVRALRQTRAMDRSGQKQKQDVKKPVKCVVM